MEEDVINKKIIGMAETILVLMLVGIEEIFEVFILVITIGAGIIITEIMNVAMAGLIEMYIILRGGRGVKKLIVQPICAVVDAFTGGLLPGKFVGTAIAIWVINHPEKTGQITGRLSKMAGKTMATAVGK